MGRRRRRRRGEITEGEQGLGHERSPSPPSTVVPPPTPSRQSGQRWASVTPREDWAIPSPGSLTLEQRQHQRVLEDDVATVAAPLKRLLEWRDAVDHKRPCFIDKWAVPVECKATAPAPPVPEVELTEACLAKLPAHPPTKLLLHAATPPRVSDDDESKSEPPTVSKKNVEGRRAFGGLPRKLPPPRRHNVDYVSLTLRDVGWRGAERVGEASLAKLRDMLLSDDAPRVVVLEGEDEDVAVQAVITASRGATVVDATTVEGIIREAQEGVYIIRRELAVPTTVRISSIAFARKSVPYDMTQNVCVWASLPIPGQKPGHFTSDPTQAIMRYSAHPIGHVVFARFAHPFSPDQYTFATSKGGMWEDPVAWEFLGSADGKEWRVCHRVEDHATSTKRNHRQQWFPLRGASDQFRWYALRVTRLRGQVDPTWYNSKIVELGHVLSDMRATFVVLSHGRTLPTSLLRFPTLDFKRRVPAVSLPSSTMQTLSAALHLVATPAWLVVLRSTALQQLAQHAIDGERLWRGVTELLERQLQGRESCHQGHYDLLRHALVEGGGMHALRLRLRGGAMELVAKRREGYEVPHCALRGLSASGVVPERYLVAKAGMALSLLLVVRCAITLKAQQGWLRDLLLWCGEGAHTPACVPALVSRCGPLEGTVWKRCCRHVLAEGGGSCCVEEVLRTTVDFFVRSRDAVHQLLSEPSSLSSAFAIPCLWE